MLEVVYAFIVIKKIIFFKHLENSKDKIMTRFHISNIILFKCLKKYLLSKMSEKQNFKTAKIC